LIRKIASTALSALALSACASAPTPPAKTTLPPAAVSSNEPAPAPAVTTSEAEAVAAEQPRPLPTVPDTLPEFSSEELQRIRYAQRFVHTAARKHGVDPQLVNGVIWVESRFQTRARGHLGPRGLMQLMPRTARALARELGRKSQPYSADFNIDAGTLYLAHMLKLFHGDTRLAVAAYNAGPATVLNAQGGGEPLSDGIENYVRKVLTAARVFEERGVH
jgi:soluble lytic murein transglycosylase-like protein